MLFMARRVLSVARAVLYNITNGKMEGRTNMSIHSEATLLLK